MIRAIRPQAMATANAAAVAGWNIGPDVGYTLILSPGAASCGVMLYDGSYSTLIASGAAAVGTAQPAVLWPMSGQSIDMVDPDLGWHLLVTTSGAGAVQTIGIGPAVDLPDEIHPVFGDDDLAVARARAAIDGAAHHLDDVQVLCPAGLAAVLGDVVSVPVDGSAIAGQVEELVWSATPQGTGVSATIRRAVAMGGA